MCLNEDIHQTRAENSFFYFQDYSTKVRHKVNIFFLFERASKTAGAREARFFIMSLDTRKNQQKG